jgi:hypothetical protein
MSQQLIERAWLVRKLTAIVNEMETMGEQDMGWVRLSFAARFHRATRQCRGLLEISRRTPS